MSYILEALKKAERERGIRRVPTLATVHDFQGIQRTRSAIIVFGIIVCAAGLMWFFRPVLSTIIRPPSPSPVSTEQNTPKNPPAAEPVANPRSVPDAPLAESVVLPKTGKPSEVPIAMPPRSAAPSSLQPEPAVRKDVAGTPAQPDTGRSMTSQTAAVLQQSGAGETSPPPQAKPTSLREAMSKLTISLLVYADAEPDRKVYINGKKYVKGDLVEGRYLIESITQEGAVLSYQGERAVLRP